MLHKYINSKKILVIFTLLALILAMFGLVYVFQNYRQKSIASCNTNYKIQPSTKKATKSYSNLDAALNDAENTRVLRLNTTEIIQIPTEIQKLVNLEEIHIANITGIGVGNPILDQFFNPIGIPCELFTLPKLEVVSIQGNNVTFLPTNIGQAKNLRELRLTRNQIEELPESIVNLNNLEILDLDGNHITYLPEDINKLESLDELILQSNPVKELPSSIKKMKNLSRLNLSYTFITIEEYTKTQEALPDTFVVTPFSPSGYRWSTKDYLYFIFSGGREPNSRD